MKKGLKQRDWNEIKTNDSWSIFKIMGEFVQGFETLQRIGPCVSIYGSARMAEDSTVYNQSREVARQLSARCASVSTASFCCFYCGITNEVEALGNKVCVERALRREGHSAKPQWPCGFRVTRRSQSGPAGSACADFVRAWCTHPAEVK